MHKENFTVFALSVWKVLHKTIGRLNICQENFRSSSKICVKHETFLLFSLCHLRYYMYSDLDEALYSR